MRRTMSPPSSPDTSSPHEALYARVNARPVSKGPESPSTWSLTPPTPVRSTLASINIVEACTSSLVITSALGSAVTISLPYMGKDLGIRKGDLQWILSAYSVSSVSIMQYFLTELGLSYAQACFLLLCGRLADLYGRKFVWLVGYLITGTCGLSAPFARCMSDATLHHFLPSF